MTQPTPPTAPSGQPTAAHPRNTPALQKIERRLLHDVGRAIADFRLIEDGDHILIGLSGGKDSNVLLVLLQKLARRAPIHFTLEAAHVDDGYVGDEVQSVRAFAQAQGIPFHATSAPIRSLVEAHLEKGEIACPLCARMRRGTLYTLAKRLECNKLALGHHLDDALETLLMNLFYAGSLRAMPPHLIRDEGPPEVIRPLCYALERDVATYAHALDLPILPCTCPNCGQGDQRRQAMKRLIDDLENQHSDVRTQMRKALGNVNGDALYDLRLNAASAEPQK